MTAAFSKRFEVRWDDVDINGHLRSTRYLEYATTTRLFFLKEAGWDIQELQKDGICLVLLNEEIHYRREVLLAQRVDVTFETVSMTDDGTRWRSRQILTRADGEIAAEIHSLSAWMDFGSRRICRPPDPLMATIRSAKAEDCMMIETPNVNASGPAGPRRL
ncbi:acyl-CoA thioesterase [Kitasatospora sp. NPDC002040]|uniref:acyl-CoA thioesterase n=1 Tax=Kitasatospora sp. NPDC002040 TaxID=3154661 RepID=UPI003325DEAA